MFSHRSHAAGWILAGLCLVASQVRAADVPSFEREVRPILSRYCFKCHGPDEGQRQSGLRLDVRESAIKAADSGKSAIVPNKTDASELIRRIDLPDGSDEKMPPASTKLELTAEQRDILKRWIASGAEYRPHWAFVAPKRPALPKVRDASWPRNGIDRFVLARLESEGLKPSPQADRHTLARRVFLDLIGIPPTPAEVEAFVHDPSSDAYEQLVDRLLASPAYGERWARRWLDLARYADTNGYEKDRTRNVWPYRDWVINAINADQPFDQFTIDQLAGDMRPNATIPQRIATGFHRNTMLNEEGGIDPLEFRFHAMTDRVATTGSVWLGLTIGCAQCHTHKYDPITHTDYYRFFGLLNNAEEPELDIPVPELFAKQAEIDRRIAELEADLPNRFPLPDEFAWTPIKPTSVKAESGANAAIDADASVFISGPNLGNDTYEVQLDSELRDVAAIRLEALSDEELPSKGPGRTPHGNFVLSEITASIAPRDKPDDSQPLKFARASADFSQEKFDVAQAIDGNTKTGGWAIHGPGIWNVNRTATFVLAQPSGFADKPTRWTIKLEQQHGTQHTLGKFRISLGRRNSANGSPDEQRRKHFDQKYAAWLAETQKSLIRWETPKVVSATSNLPLLTVEENGVVFVSGDMSKSDLYELTLKSSLKEIVALRLEALPDDRLPKHGPGRVYYEGPFGDFFLSDIALTVGETPRRFARATQTFAAGNSNAMAALDDNKQTGWSINGGQGKPHTAVFQLAEPLTNTGLFKLRMLFERYYAPGLGKFRISMTSDPRAVEAPILPADVERALNGTTLAAGTATGSKPAASAVPLTKPAALVKQFCATAPELSSARQEVESLRVQRPTLPTSLVMQERPANNPRPTHRHHRGEYLQPKELVAAGSLSALPPLPANSSADRLALANWLVSPNNPLTARVTVNRHWAAFFGRGLVRTQEDFGFQGALPSHPELLDWLATEFVGRFSKPSFVQDGLENRPTSWSLKRLHRLIVTSATYQQSSRVAPELLQHDTQNELLARGPRFRVEAESVRDSLLSISGLLGRKLGGPSVFPPQPANITTEGTYGQLAWKVSEGLDRHRRSLYTFAKRTAPFAMFTTFDAPSGEACVVRREVSNTPLQALTLLNDVVFTEASQALGRQFAALPNSDDARLAELFRRCLTRPPTDAEITLLSRFLKTQRERLATKELDAATLAGPGEGDASERAAWSLVARALLNLDEAVTKD
ncbi:MAG: PSD1 and planctomycete cytochrome C domain-containing protein [Planctomycetaceae bacterium]